MQTRFDDSNLNRAWSDFVASYPATFAVTLAYNPIWTGTVCPADRITEADERIRLPMPALRARSGVWQLATPRKIPCERIHANVGHLHRNVDRKLFGTRFHKLSPKQRTGYIGLIENPETNAHVHLAWRVPPNRSDEFTGLIRPLWRKMEPYGTADVERIYDVKGWGWYCTKRRPARKDPELFVASRT
jgi:hypothetical protein